MPSSIAGLISALLKQPASRRTVATYITQGVAEVAVTEDNTATIGYTATCAGCGLSTQFRDNTTWDSPRAESAAGQQQVAAETWAQRHAATCY